MGKPKKQGHAAWKRMCYAPGKYYNTKKCMVCINEIDPYNPKTHKHHDWTIHPVLTKKFSRGTTGGGSL